MKIYKFFLKLFIRKTFLFSGTQDLIHSTIRLQQFAKNPYLRTKYISMQTPSHVSTFVVSSPCELLPFLMEQLKNQKSRNAIKSLLAHNQVWVNQKLVRQFDYTLLPQSTVTIHWDKQRMEETIVKQTFKQKNDLLRIIAEDEDYIVIDKAAGLLSIATGKEKIKTAFSLLSDYVKQQNPQNRIFVVHRLDRDTSGLMVFAKSTEAQTALQYDWKNNIDRRRYVAVVEGEMQTGDGTGKGIIRSYLRESKAFIVYSSPNPENGILAVTHYEILSATPEYSLMAFELETGRKNQIRVHMQSIGHPIVGDIKYGGHPSPIKRLALHATELSFTNPISHQSYHLISPVPKAFYTLGKF